MKETYFYIFGKERFLAYLMLAIISVFIVFGVNLEHLDASNLSQKDVLYVIGVFLLCCGIVYAERIVLTDTSITFYHFFMPKHKVWYEDIEEVSVRRLKPSSNILSNLRLRIWGVDPRVEMVDVVSIASTHTEGNLLRMPIGRATSPYLIKTLQSHNVPITEKAGVSGLGFKKKDLSMKFIGRAVVHMLLLAVAFAVFVLALTVIYAISSL